MIFSVVLLSKEVSVEIEPEDYSHPVRMWMKDMSVSMSSEEATKLGQNLLNAVQEINYLKEKPDEMPS